MYRKLITGQEWVGGVFEIVVEYKCVVGTPIEQKMDAFGRPNSGGKGKLFSIFSLISSFQEELIV
jgi:hypothetical protein